MNVLTYPLRYLVLKDEKGSHLYLRDGLAVVAMAVIGTIPFAFTNANYFGPDGFLDKFGSFSGILTGFYIAGLVGVASFTSSMGDLDEVIEHGKVLRKGADGDIEPLTRRQYVSSMFGYLAFLSLAISVVGILFVIGDGATGGFLPWLPIDPNIKLVFRAIVVLAINLVLAHMVVTTFHGFYYLIDRLYEKKAVLLPKDDKKE